MSTVVGSPEGPEPFPFTARESEIAKLVAQGLSNKEIADRLTVSVRTVEGHVYRMDTKRRHNED
jgi:DNA-binding CsgD family transcriptional regulator